MCYIDGQNNKYSVLNECNRKLKYNAYIQIANKMRFQQQQIILTYVLCFISDESSNSCRSSIIVCTKMVSTECEVPTKPQEADTRMKTLDRNYKTNSS
jgi:hypothetical protein